jgi:hypothetical protein
MTKHRQTMANSAFNNLTAYRIPRRLQPKTSPPARIGRRP